MGKNRDPAAGAVPEPIYQAARACYAERGWAVTPVRGKRPLRQGWQVARTDPRAQQEQFAGATGFGVVLGLSGLVDLEADCPTAERALDGLAPETGCVWQHGGRKHRLYRSEAAYREWVFQRQTLVEVRGGAHQSVAPPSIHPETGQPYRWVAEGEPASMPPEPLYRAALLAAVAAACAGRWPRRGRHQAALALAGTLRRGGVSREEARVVMDAVCAAAGDEEPENRQEAVEDTYDRPAGVPLTGLPTLSSIVGRELADWIAEHLPDGIAGGGRPSARAHPGVGSPSAARGDFTDNAPIAPTEPCVDHPPPLAEEAFHGFAGRFVRAVAPHTEADPAALLINLLIWAANLIGPTAYARVGPDIHRLKENAVLVGPSSSGRKGTSAGPCRELFGYVDADWVGHILHGLSTGEGLIWAVRDPIVKRAPVREKGRIIGYEEQIEDPGVEDKRLLVLEAEFANVLKVMTREGNTLSVQVRQAWDLDLIRSVTKNNPAVATGAFISMVGHITPEELRRYFSETEAANGFGNRFLWVCVRRSKLLPEGGGEMGLIPLAVELAAIVERARSLGEIQRDAASRAVWAAIYPELTAEASGMFGAVTSRAAAHVLRLSAIYAALDGSALIRVPHLLAAVAVWDYCRASARLLFGDASGDTVADQILAALRGARAGLSRAQIYDLLSRKAPRHRITQALQLLQRAKRARHEEQPTEGRPREVWFAREVDGLPVGALLATARDVARGWPAPDGDGDTGAKSAKSVKSPPCTGDAASPPDGAPEAAGDEEDVWVC